MSSWDRYWDEEAGLLEEFFVSLRSTTETEMETEKLHAWVKHLCLHYEINPESVSDYFSIHEAVFHLAAEKLGLLEESKYQQLNASELSHIFKIWPKFKEYCEDSCSGFDAWTLLKFKKSIAHEVDSELINAALQLAE
jgi:hypothetical protein